MNTHTTTSAAQHTPGPWRVFMTGQAPGLCHHYIHAGGNAHISDSFRCVASVHCHDLDPSLNAANARLIALAPELAAALARRLAYDTDFDLRCRYSDESMRAMEREDRALLARLSGPGEVRP